ncbi:Uncharacterised protein [Vibrio cholerae]|nr:Uncharacterised protein [Vibrio cholerae]CSI04440.1 Uncharacterised protein [Vibrio cholerae]
MTLPCSKTRASCCEFCAPCAWAVKPVVDMRKKPSSQNVTLIIVLPSATPPKYQACSR